MKVKPVLVCCDNVIKCCIHTYIYMYIYGSPFRLATAQSLWP